MNKEAGSGKVNWADEQYIKMLVSESISQSDVLRKLGLTPSSNAVTLRKYIAKYNIDTSHFDPKAQLPGSKNGATKEPLSVILVENSNRVDRYQLKKRIVQEGVLDYRCAKCGNGGEWEGESLTLQLEHKNGINNDHRVENLEFLCPNCHSQTKTFAGRNKNK